MRHSMETNPPKQLTPVKLGAVRIKRGLSKNRLAALSELQPGVVGWIESGRFIPYDSQLRRLAAALDWPQDRRGELLDPLEGAPGASVWEA